MSTLLEPSDLGRMCELEYESKWFRVVMAPLSADDPEVHCFFVNEKSSMPCPREEAEGILRAKGTLKWSAADVKKAKKIATTECWSLEGVEDDEEPAPPPVQPRKKQPSTAPAAVEAAASSGGRPKRGAASRAQESFKKAESSDDDDDDDSVADNDERVPKRAKASATKKQPKAAARGGRGKRKGAPAESDEEAAFSDGSEGAEDGDDDDEYDDDDDGGGGSSRKRKPAGKKKAAAPAKGTAKPACASKTTWPFDEKKKKRPPKQPSQPFVDPAGLDIEDRGVEWIVERQCECLEPLLRDAVAHKELSLSMATACSGTDAPVVAMIVAKEALARKGVNFDFTHTMSCELEPYKQSFIARNHPDVLIFPDIRVLGTTPKGGQATTVYGGKAAVPSADMLVAGTSCKDFSGLKGRDRKSIEALGTSGQTFFGFVELLLEQGYRTAIIENVQGAEWHKMAQYISGRVPVRDAADLGFAKEKSGAWVVSEVSAVAGVRAGTKLKGVAKHKSGRIVALGGGSSKKSTASFHDLAKEHGLDDGDTLIFELPVEYHCKLLDMDAKEFGLPQTRTRNYMLIWRPELYPEGADVSELWMDLVDFLRCPLKFPIDSFLLADESDRVHRFRDALLGPLGRLTALSKQSGDWWDRSTSASNKDTDKHVEFRECKGKDYKPTNKNLLSTPAELLARPWTGWGPNSHLSLSCHDWWPEYLSVLSQRELDLIDCFGLVGPSKWGGSNPAAAASAAAASAAASASPRCLDRPTPPHPTPPHPTPCLLLSAHSSSRTLCQRRSRASTRCRD